MRVRIVLTTAVSIRKIVSLKTSSNLLLSFRHSQQRFVCSPRVTLQRIVPFESVDCFELWKLKEHDLYFILTFSQFLLFNFLRFAIQCFTVPTIKHLKGEE